MSSTDTLDLQPLTGHRLGPYLSYNPVSRVQIWQWCSAMGDNSPLYLSGKDQQGAIAPPAMMQMWTMRDVRMEYAPGSTTDRPYQIFDTLTEVGFPANVAVSYDITFHRYLDEGDRAKHYTTVVSISDLKETALGRGHFVTEHVEYLDQNEALFAEALITYFQYQPLDSAQTEEAPQSGQSTPPAPVAENSWSPDFADLRYSERSEGEVLPELVIPITHKLIVSGAAATQDYIDVHHNVPAARAAAMPDIFMNILTTSGLCARYLSDWAGPASRLNKLSFKLMAPNTPGDTMTMQGRVSALGDNNQVSVGFAGKNNLGFHVTGSATLSLNE